MAKFYVNTLLPLLTWEQGYLLLMLSTTDCFALQVSDIQAEPTINTGCQEKPGLRENRLKTIVILKTV